MANLKAKVAALLATLGGLECGCLPKDSRPPPAEVVVQASSADSIYHGFDTSDGWHVAFSRFLLTIGRASLDGDGCNEYNRANYERVLDMQQASPQKVALVYGLGMCDFSFGVVHPVSDSVLGLGVSAEQALSMRTAGSDLYTAFSGQLTGIDTFVQGLATRGAESKSFEWAFRLDYYFLRCSSGADAGGATTLNLNNQETVTVDLVADGATLFLADSPLQVQGLFEPFAMADTKFGDNDGRVTLEELAQVPVAVVDADLGDAGVQSRIVPWDAGAGAAAGNGMSNDVDASTGHAPGLPPRSLGDYVYYFLYPRLVRYQGIGQCTATNTRPRRGPG